MLSAARYCRSAMFDRLKKLTCRFGRRSDALSRLAARGRLAQVGTGFATFDLPPAGERSISDALEAQRADRV